ncbi:MAG: 16S rRNA (cytosine(967)-C(5))-methyltransferase RsmB [Ignavibacteriales bacterium]|nr:MAG: 16S rRNA (cytosine(967)-C(5))-methyltransferase RsmB [Ignavibacteriales bacterium]
MENSENTEQVKEQEPVNDQNKVKDQEPEKVLEQEKVNLYAGVRGIAVKILNRVDRTDAYLDKLIDHEFKNSELSGQDKALLFEIVHGVLRWMGKLDWILNGFYKGAYSKCIPNVKNALRVGLYQILYLEKIPDYAAVNEAVEFVKRLQGQKPADQANAVLRNIIRSKEGIRFPNPEEDLIGYFSAFYSHPSWLVRRWLNFWGQEQTEALLIANNEKPSLTLRVNTSKTTVDEFKELLKKVDLKFYDGKFLNDFIKLKTLTNITGWEYFEKGYFSIQDESTGLPCRLLDVKPGLRVLDLCAAPGGKASYISNLMNNTGEIIALDRYESRLKILEKNLQRMGATNITLKEENALENNSDEFDRVLLDAPCSGFGTLSKKPDIKWKRDLGDIRELTKLQYELLQKAASLVKVDGSIVYSTCTIEPEENYDIVKKFLDNNPNFVLEDARNYVSEKIVTENGCIQTYPHVHQLDGAFAAKLVRKS